jgi:hypothetical protein
MDTQPEATRRTAANAPLARPVVATLLAWLAMIGVDLLLHAGVLAPLYDWDSPFLLSPTDAFVRIPAGYLAFGILAAAIVWLLPRLGVRDARSGAAVAGLAGAVLWGGLVLGLWSISTAEPALLAGWWVGQSAELAIGGAVIGALIAGTRVRTMAWRVAGIVFAGLVVAVVLQSIGYAPAPIRLNGG